MTDERERDRDLRNFLLPFIYGLAGANFIALIQFAPAAQFKVEWKIVEKAESLSEVSPAIGFLGVVVISARISILLAYAVHCELVLKRKKHVPEMNPLGLSLLLMLGIIGIALALLAFHPAFGIAFVSAMLAIRLKRRSN